MERNYLSIFLALISNILLWYSIAFRNKTVQNIAWILWITLLIVEIRRDRSNHFKAILYGILAILLAAVLIHSLIIS